MKVFGKEMEVRGYTVSPIYFKSGYFLGSTGRTEK